MKEKNLNQIYGHLFEFSSLFHQKFGIVFHKHNGYKHKCNKNQSKAIMTIGKREKITPSALGKYLDMQKGSLTTLIDSLEEMNLVSRASDPNDRRKTLLQLTKEGEDYRQLKMEEFKKNLVILFDSLPEEEIEDFAKNLENIVNTIKKV